MNVPTPPRLLDLARTSLLRDEDSVISALEFLPTELFPPLFVEAFQGRHTETLKAMVQAWPFVRLPLGALIDLPHVQCWKHLTSSLPRRFPQGEPDLGNLVKSWVSQRRQLG